MWLPQALSLGIDYNLFWELSPKRTEPFIEASKLKRKMENFNMWKHGLYIQSAVASVLSEKNKYYEEPIDFEAEHTEEQEAAKWKAWAMNVNAHTVLHKADE